MSKPLPTFNNSIVSPPTKCEQEAWPRPAGWMSAVDSWKLSEQGQMELVSAFLLPFENFSGVGREECC